MPAKRRLPKTIWAPTAARAKTRKRRGSFSAPPRTRAIAKRPRKRARGTKTVVSSVRRGTIRPTISQALRFLSPWGKGQNPLPSQESLGVFTTLSHIGRFNLQTQPTAGSGPILMVYQPSARGIYQVSTWQDTGVVWEGGHLLDGPLASMATADAPLQMRCMRAGVRIKNVTESRNVGGTVRIFVSSSPIDLSFVGTSANLTVPSFNSIVETARTNPRAREYGGIDFAKSDYSEIVLPPAVFASFNSYGNAPFRDDATIGDYLATQASVAQDMSMASLIVVWEQASLQNDYAVSIACQNAYRYPTNTTLGNMAAPAPHGNQMFVDAAQTAVAAHGSQFAGPSQLFPQ